jgi:hypothetical protein
MKIYLANDTSSFHAGSAAVMASIRHTLVAQDFRAIKGLGTEAMIDGHLFWVGSHRLLNENGVEESEIHAPATPAPRSVTPATPTPRPIAPPLLRGPRHLPAADHPWRRSALTNRPGSRHISKETNNMKRGHSCFGENGDIPALR